MRLANHLLSDLQAGYLRLAHCQVHPRVGWLARLMSVLAGGFSSKHCAFSVPAEHALPIAASSTQHAAARMPPRGSIFEQDNSLTKTEPTIPRPVSTDILSCIVSQAIDIF